MKIRPHQTQKANELLSVLKTYKCAYLIGEVRSGKTITVLETAKKYGVKNVLFITKKKAISSIQSDFNNIGYQYNITITNYESLHKIERTDFDLIIYDEAHGLGAFPKPSKRTKLIRELFYNTPCIWLSGTPCTESFCQYFHQFWVSGYSPFKKYSNFYKWAKDCVDITEKRIGTHIIKDYTNIKTEAMPMLKSFIDLFSVVMTQEDAGFEVSIKEHIITVPTPNKIHLLAQKLIKDRAVEGKKGFIMAEMPAKLQSKIHQIYNGTVILETIEGNNTSVSLSSYKAEFIKEYFKDKKIAIMYYYQQELEILKETFGSCLTTSINEFNTTYKHFAIQQSSTEGMNISKADCLVYYNFGFSGKNFVQSRDRLTVKDRLNNDVYFILEEKGINEKILKAVQSKSDYNLRSFKKDFL
jgi:hypothetical protein